MATLFQGDKYSIIKREGEADSSPDWDSKELATLCDSLFKNPAARRLFLNSYIVNHPPLLVSDPSRPFSNQINFGSSSYFNPETILIFREDESRERLALKKLMSDLVEARCLILDPMKIIKCSCDHFSIGMGDSSKSKSFYCTYCSVPGRSRRIDRVIPVYSFTPLVRDVLIVRGKILEGIIYHSLLKEKIIFERYQIVPSAYLVGDPKLGPGLQHELDLVLCDKLDNTIKPIVILVSISLSQGEKEQVRDCITLGHETIFVCGGGINTQAHIHKSGAKVFQQVIEEENFIDPLVEYISKGITKN